MLAEGARWRWRSRRWGSTKIVAGEARLAVCLKRCLRCSEPHRSTRMRIAVEERSSRRPHLAGDLFVEQPQRMFESADPGLVIQIEHATDLTLFLAQLLRQRDLAQPVLA